MRPQPMSKKKKMILIISGIVVFLLIILIIILSKQSSLGKPTVVFSPPATVSERKQAAIDQIENKIKSPVETKDFILRIDPFSKKIVFIKKTANADEALKEWLKENNLPNVLQSIQLTNKEIATKVLAWLDKTRVFGEKLDNPSPSGEYISNGGYAYGLFCGDNFVCSDLISANNYGLYAVWARYKYYEATKDPAALAILKKDIATYADFKSISSIQPTLWSFRLMYEIWKNPLLASEKDKLEIIFYRIQQNPEVITPIEDIIKKNGVIKEINIPLFQAGSYDTNDGTVIQNKLNTYAAYSSEYLYAYLVGKKNNWENPDQYLYIARGLFNNGVRSYVKDGLTENDDPALLGVAALDLYKVTPNKQYLDFATFLYNQYMVTQTCQKIDKCANMVYFIDLLNKQIPDQQKTDRIKQIIENLYQTKFDYEGADGYQFGVGAFYDLKMNAVKNTLYGLMPNALIAGVLSGL
jgi:hypothetical protein